MYIGSKLKVIDTTIDCPYLAKNFESVVEMVPIQLRTKILNIYVDGFLFYDLPIG